MTAIHSTIAAEVKRLATFYGVDGPAFDAAVQPFFFDAYTEIILGREGFEVLVGAVDARDRLVELATRLDVQAPTVRLFRAFSTSFPGRIGYLKLGFGPRPDAPTMHCGAIASWHEVFDFMDEEPEFAGARPALSAIGEAHPLCHLVGFSADRDSGEPIMKVYWLLDQPPVGRGAPMLASARVSKGTVRSESKRYFMGTTWDAASIDERWSHIVEVARREFTDSAWLCASDLLVRATVRERKLYVFRHDSRVSTRGMSNAFNLYYAEGIHHLQRGDVDQAARSFTNAIAFQPDHAHAYNNRGYCWIQKGEYWRAIVDCTRARLYDETIATSNLAYAQARVPRELATPEWLAFERSLVTSNVPVADDGTREPDLLDLRDGAAMLAALEESRADSADGALLPRCDLTSRLVLQPNEGAGDCLFQALSGGELEDDALARLRAQVAAVRRRLPEDPRGNRLRVLAALLQTPATRERGLALAAEGALGLRNEACAALQAVRGVFAGEPEIEQWCELTGRIVAVLDASGAARVLSGAGTIESVSPSEALRRVDQWLREDVVVLLRTPGHWQRVLGVQNE
jgi:Tfp pilus assembly protein PilF